ncbi:MAG: hypothetical protein CSYNP_04144 [Syntrophus sp. SKADARSKE-3]|nr:hypothetical protein [Syntrophus sp. SKADARSKE-3]
MAACLCLFRFDTIRLTSSASSYIRIATYSQGGVEFPTGGIPVDSGKPASAPASRQGVSRPGETPGPTVTVRMEEDKAS